MHTHNYNTTITWTGNTGQGTVAYKSYERNHTISVTNKPLIPGSSDPSFRGDPTRYNPEELLVAALSSCHMLFFLHICAVSGIVVTEYIDHASGEMTEGSDGGGHFKTVTLNPTVIVKQDTMIERTKDAHHQAAKLCFISNSVNFPVTHNLHCTSENQMTTS